MYLPFLVPKLGGWSIWIEIGFITGGRTKEHKWKGIFMLLIINYIQTVCQLTVSCFMING
ncbi:hypothetical protein HMPREF1218_0838 [Hoylesella pleuritidis F0068]|uniref:Uncharacterized protein n=1 Tax=Hoylesella pleuritidis F0068 TaxID=1081904 RepID=U2L0F6_9BACT|nr:hypothetical protein HMPREF1218_0838 [Hoylesella pleuritidis F0068]